MSLKIQVLTTLVILLAAFNRVHGEDLPNPSDCVGKVDKFPNCDNVNSISKKCSNLSKQETIDCFCTQDLLNSYQGCKGEIRQCVLSNSFDSAIDDEIANWLDACSAYLPSDITTPSVAQPTRTLNGDTCQTFIESCAHLSQSITSCSSAYTKPADITSCRCQSSLVSLASVCNLDGPESCIGTTAARSDIWELQHCAAATQALPTSKTTRPITKTMGGSPGSNATPTGTLIFGPTTTTSTSDGAVLVTFGSCKMFLRLLLGSFWCLFYS